MQTLEGGARQHDSHGMIHTTYKPDGYEILVLEINLHDTILHALMEK